MKKVFGIVCLMVSLQGFAQDSAVVSVDGAYTGEFFYTPSGVVHDGGAYLGVIDFSLTFTPQKIPGSEFYIQFENTHGTSPSSEYLGDMQVASNIDNGDFSYLYELWYKQTIGSLTFQAGKVDLNADFLASENAGEYINSSFGIMPTASLNFPVSIFPKNTLALNVFYEINESFQVQAGIFDGDPLDLDSDPYSIDFNISKDDGVLGVVEVHHKTGDNLLKAGFLTHSSDFNNWEDNSTGKNWTAYAIDDYSLGSLANRDIVCFCKAGYAPSKYNLTNVFIGAGVNSSNTIYKGDVLGLAVAHCSLSKTLKDISPVTFDKSHETVVELTYTAPIADYFCLKPDVQYIINPSFSSADGNVLALFLRFCVEM